MFTWASPPPTSGETLLNAALQDANWTGTLPAAQDYYLSITAGGSQTSYAVTIKLTPLPTTAAATATALPPVVSGLFNPVAAYGEADFEDPMTGSAISDWEDDDGDLPDTLYLRLTLDDARFYVTGKLAGFSTWYFTWRDLSDFYLQATMDSGSCSGQDAYGLIVRGPEHMAGVSYGYVVAFTCDGKLWVYRLDGADPFTATDLVSLTPSQYINAGANQRNLIGIQAIGDQLTIYANGLPDRPGDRHTLRFWPLRRLRQPAVDPLLHLPGGQPVVLGPRATDLHHIKFLCQHCWQRCF